MGDYGIQSDSLKQLRPYYGENGPLANLASVFQLNLILDANVVISELRWAVAKRKSEMARSELLEVLEVETVVAYAPTFLEAEVTLHIAETLVGEQGLDESALLAHWQRVRALIRFVDVGGVPPVEEGHLDPKDVPYLRLQERIAAHILTRDKDIEAMGGTVVPISILGALRAYSRTSVVQFSLEVGGSTLGSVTLVTLTHLAKSTFSATRKLGAAIPREVWLCAFALGCLILAFPSARKAIGSVFADAVSRFAPVTGASWQAMGAVTAEYRTRRLATEQALAIVKLVLQSSAPEVLSGGRGADCVYSPKPI
jgi:predicted nucleic acid-binding protein